MILQQYADSSLGGVDFDKSSIGTLEGSRSFLLTYSRFSEPFLPNFSLKVPTCSQTTLLVSLEKDPDGYQDM